MILEAINRHIALLEAELAVERQIIANAVSAHQIGKGYWQRCHDIEGRLRAAIALRDALSEALA